MIVRMTLCMVFSISLMVTQPVFGENWPAWRGPRGDGTCDEQNVPIQWDGTTGKNIRWKVEVQGKGHSSPVVWEGKLFLSTCLEENEQRSLLCFDANTGKEIWRRDVLKAPLESRHQLNSFASGTPATDGELVFVAFLKIDGKKIPAPNVSNPRDVFPGRVVVSAFDFQGNLRWQSDIGEFISVHGFCSCPVLYKDLVIINGDHDGNGYIIALNKSTGKEVWRTEREHNTRSYVTPIIRTIHGQDQLVMSGSKHIAAFDPQNGQMIWKVEGPTEQYVASMVFDGERFFMAAGFPTHHVMAIRPDGKGDVTKSHVAWHIDKYVKCYVPSPIVVGSNLYVADDRGTASCFVTTDGSRIWQERMGASYSASLVATKNAVYFLADNGIAKVVSTDKEHSVLSENNLGENCYASPAISDGRIYLRGTDHLFCIETAKDDKK